MKNKIREVLKDLKEYRDIEDYQDLKNGKALVTTLKTLEQYDDKQIKQYAKTITVATSSSIISLLEAIEDAVEDIEDILDEADFDDAIIKSSDPFDRWILIEIKRTTAAIITEQIPLYLANVLSFDIESTYNGFQYVVTTKNNIKYLLTQESFNEASQILFEMYNPKGEQ